MHTAEGVVLKLVPLVTSVQQPVSSNEYTTELIQVSDKGSSEDTHQFLGSSELKLTRDRASAQQAST